MDKTPEKPINISNISNNSLNKSSHSFAKEASLTQEKRYLDATETHKHKHDKKKCVICMAKEQKTFTKKKTNFEESKKLKPESSLKIVATTSQKEFGVKDNRFEDDDDHKFPQKPNLVMKTMRHPSLTILFDPQRDEHPNKPYYLDGDSKMYTPEMIELRESLKSDPVVRKAINGFMILYQFDSQNLLSKKGYIDVNYKIVSLLRPELKGEDKHEEMKFTLEQDWKHDSKGRDKMTKDDLVDSLYELVDIWTTGVDNMEYGSFFDMLKMKIILEEQKNPHHIPYDILY